MTSGELMQTVLSIQSFYPPEGVEVALVVRPKPGVCRASVEMWAGRVWRECRLSEPPSQDALMALYREAVDVLNESRRPQAEVLGLDLARMGNDG